MSVVIDLDPNATFWREAHTVHDAVYAAEVSNRGHLPSVKGFFEKIVQSFAFLISMLLCYLDCFGWYLVSNWCIY